MKFVHFGFDDFIVVAIHPDHNMVFFVFGLDKTLMSYDMDSRKLSVICNLGRTCKEHFLPYIPCFSNSLPDGGNGNQSVIRLSARLNLLRWS
jgi:hypothetical protein